MIEKMNLFALYEKVKGVEFASILEQLQNKDPLRKEIHRMFFSILGYNDKEIEDVLGWMYDAISNEIQILRELMGEGTEREDLEERYIDEFT